MDAGTFRAAFPAFSDTVKYQEASVSYWLGIAALMLRSDRWGDLLDHAQGLFTAHNLTLFGGSSSNALSGGTKGVLTGKTIGKVSVTYDAKIGTLTDAGAYNLSTYGVQFYQLMQMAGTGGIQVGAGYCAGPGDPVYPFGWN